jgi:DNA polymerase-3 subunit delta'
MSWWDEAVLDRERWRPLIDPVLERVVLARDRGRYPHALMLVGPPGMGRELAAVETAALLTCPNAAAPWVDNPCCSRVREGLHPDVTAVLPEGKAQLIKIGQIREVVDSAPGRPYEGQCRVWILDGVESGRFGAEAANAFLKTLEEPPEHVRFLLLAANPSAVLPTIASRCQQLMLPGAMVVADHLGQTALPELAGITLSGQDVEEVVDGVRSALRCALAGELTELLRLASALPEGIPVFEVVAGAALEEAAASSDQEIGEELVRLASSLAQTDRRVRALNLNPPRQLTACLLGWYRDMVP